MAECMRLEYSSAITDLTEVNPSFDKGMLRIAYTGKNRNNSFITKEAFEDAANTMYGVPVVANYIREEDEIGSHDGEFITDRNGELDYVNITQPVGFVPQDAKWNWEIVKDDGEIHQYMTTEVILWRRQEAYSKIKENGITAQSMEINVTDGEMLDDYYKINKFYFTAFCLLGKAEPCFESAALFTFAKAEDMQKQLNEMYEEFKLAFNVDFKQTNEEGGLNDMDKLKELLERYQVNESELGFEVEGLTDEELESKFAEMFEEQNEEEQEAEPSAEEGNEEPAESFALSGQVESELRRLVRDRESVETDYGFISRFFLVDYDAEALEVYYEDYLDNWNLYGSTYSYDGDSIKIDFDSAKRKKFAIVDYVEGSDDANFTLDIIETIKGSIVSSHEEKYAVLEDEYNKLSENHNCLVSEIAKNSALEVVGRFEEKLSDVAEFTVIKSDIEKNGLDCSLEELEDKLYALIGKKNFKYSPKSNRSPKVPVDVEHIENQQVSPYGDLFNFMKK